MRTAIVFESMYGNTHHIANAIAEELREFGPVNVVPAHAATTDLVAVDLLVVGGPTHAHGMSRPSTRQAAVEKVAKPDTHLTLDPDAIGDGVREWLEAVNSEGTNAAAFDTRVAMMPALTGRASRGIAKVLRRQGFELVVPPESFLVSKDTHLEPGEDTHARTWARQLGTLAATRLASFSE